MDYDLGKQIDGRGAAEEVCRFELYGCTGVDMVAEMKPYFADFPNVKNNCLRFEVSPSVEESAAMKPEDWESLASDFLRRMGLENHQYVAVKHTGTERKKEQAHLHILVNRVSLSGELYKDSWIGKRATEAANGIAEERKLPQAADIGKANRAEIKQAMDSVLTRMQEFDLGVFGRELGRLGFEVREARASTGRLNGYYVKSRSGTEYKASEIGRGYTLAHIEKTRKKMQPQQTEFRVGANSLTIHSEQAATIRMRGRDFDASAILSGFKRIGADWRCISPSEFEKLLRGQEIALLSGGKEISVRIQKGINGYVLKSAVAAHKAAVQEAAKE